jgi:ribonuclease BN (tRNA processing enzyme)
MTNSSTTLRGSVAEIEATHGRDELKAMARERGIPTAGITKRDIITLLLEEPYSRGRPSEILPETMPSLVSQQPLFQGKAYRVDIPNWGIPGNATAGDIVRFEQKELGNDLGVSDDLIRELDKYRYSDVVWVTKKKADAEYYLSEGMTKADISEFTLGRGARIIADDKQGGFLVLFGDAKPNPQPVPMTRGDNLLQYYTVPPSAY